MIKTTQTNKGYTIATQGTEDRNPCIILTATRWSIFDKDEEEDEEEEEQNLTLSCL